MNQRSLIFLASCVLFVPIQVTWPQTTQPGVDPDIPPGTETPQGDVLLQGKAPQPLVPEIQPGTETPRAGDTGMAPGTGPLPGTRNSGDEDDIEDLQVERQTVKGGGILLICMLD